MDKELETILNQFPVYDGKPEHFVESRQYWENIFRDETNRDPELHKAFSELHEKMVNIVIEFCKEHKLKNVHELHLSIDGIEGSTAYGKWTSCTDSSMLMYKFGKPDHGLATIDRKNPFLYEI